MSFDPAIVERARAVNMLVVTERHGLKLAKRRQEYIGACPHCGGCSRFSVNLDKAVFLCRGCKTGGCGAVDLKSSQRRQLPAGDRDADRRTDALGGRSASRRGRAQGARTRQRKPEQIDTARWLWEQRQRPQGTIVERYLASPRLYRIPATLGYLPARDQYPPAMIGCYAEPIELDGELRAPRNDEVHAVHITRLLPDGSDRRRDKDNKGREVGNKITIGAPLGFPIAIAPLTDSLALALCEKSRTLSLIVPPASALGRQAGRATSAKNSPRSCRRSKPYSFERHPDEASYTAIATLRDWLTTLAYVPEIIIREASS